MRTRILAIVPYLFSIIVVAIAFSSIATQPGSVLTETSGDAIKNYFTYLYHALYGKGVWFQGMNFPYGEHIVYTDGQPVLSVPLSYLQHTLQLSMSNAVAILHISIMASYVLGIVYTYYILRRFNVNIIWALVFAALIMLLSPQIFRLSGHYALAYSCVVPMLFYWSILYKDTNRIKYPLYIFALTIIAVFCHPYYLGMIGLWVCMYTLGYVFTSGTLKKKVLHVLPLLLAVIVSFVAFKGLMRFTDPAKDRPSYPWGMVDYSTKIEQVVTSTYSPFWQLFKDKPFFSKLDSGGEGNGYVGLITVIVLAISICVSMIISAKRQSLKNFKKSRFSPIWILIATGCLLVAMGYPFISYPRLYNFIPAFKQFRAVGRFNWIFFYVMTTYAAVMLYKWHAQLREKKKIIAYLVLLLPAIIWTWEVTGYTAYSHERAARGKENYSRFFVEDGQGWLRTLKENGYRNTDFKAILALPLFNVGTEKLWITGDRSDQLMRNTFQASLQLQLPIVDVMMSRTSWSQTFNQVRLVAGPVSDKSVLNDGNKKPFLILHEHEVALDLDARYLLHVSSFIGQYKGYDMYRCYPDSILAADKRYQDSAMAIARNMPAGDTCIACNSVYFTEHYNEGKGRENFFGPSALPISGGDTTLFSIPINVADSTLYEFSAWAWVNDVDFGSHRFDILLLDENDNTIATIGINSTNAVDNKKMWLRASKYFSVPANCKKISGKTFNEGYIGLDEVLLRPANAMVITKAADGSMMVNNHILKR